MSVNTPTLPSLHGVASDPAAMQPQPRSIRSSLGPPPDPVELELDALLEELELDVFGGGGTMLSAEIVSFALEQVVLVTTR